MAEQPTRRQHEVCAESVDNKKLENDTHTTAAVLVPVADSQEEPPSKKIKIEEKQDPALATTTEGGLTAQPTRPTALPAKKETNDAASSNPTQATAALSNVSQKTADVDSVTTQNEGQPAPKPSLFSPGCSDSAPSSSTLRAAVLKQPAKVDDGGEAEITRATKLPGTPPPLKSITMGHLRAKYMSELEYMLREFRKLERQLLGAKGATQIEESAGSRERREKLHSFILHLEDTIQQIELGCKLESEGETTLAVGVTASTVTGVSGKPIDATTLSQEGTAGQPLDPVAITREKEEEEENVQKLEEHILADLLPVKVRLKKQLAAQQGASRNPAGMPAPRRGMLRPAAAEPGKGTFAEAAEQRRKQAEAARLAAEEAKAADTQTQFGKPLKGGGSSLTQKLHGSTLGSSKRRHGHGVGSSEPVVKTESEPDKPRILYGGMALGSEQMHSGVQAAAGVHKMVIENSSLLQKPAQSVAAPPEYEKHEGTKSESGNTADAKEASTAGPRSVPTESSVSTSVSVSTTHVTASPKGAKATTKPPYLPSSSNAKRKRLDDATLTEEERKKVRRKRKKKKKLRDLRRRERERQRQSALHQQAVQSVQLPTKSASGRKKMAVGKSHGKKKGPRSVEYICALCSEAYSSTCDYNPWWALAQHECPKCRKTQIPRVDITAPTNAIEYHPALLAHADDASASNAGTGNNNALQIAASRSAQATALHKPTPIAHQNYSSDSDSDSDLSDVSDGSLSDDSMDSDDSDTDALRNLTPADKAEIEDFGNAYKGPRLSDSDAGRLLVLMSHASTCPCRHKSAKHRDVCKSIKYLMLHVRDCPGTTATFDVCPFPWCRKVKHLLFHLVTCQTPTECSICIPRLSPNLSALVGLNEFRRNRHVVRMQAMWQQKAASASRLKAQAGTNPKSGVYRKGSVTKMPAPYNDPKATPRVPIAKSSYQPDPPERRKGALVVRQQSASTQKVELVPEVSSIPSPASQDCPGSSKAPPRPQPSSILSTQNTALPKQTLRTVEQLAKTSLPASDQQPSRLQATTPPMTATRNPATGLDEVSKGVHVSHGFAREVASKSHPAVSVRVPATKTPSEANNEDSAVRETDPVEQQPLQVTSQRQASSPQIKPSYAAFLDLARSAGSKQTFGEEQPSAVPATAALVVAAMDKQLLAADAPPTPPVDTLQQHPNTESCGAIANSSDSGSKHVPAFVNSLVVERSSDAKLPEESPANGCSNTNHQPLEKHPIKIKNEHAALPDPSTISPSVSEAETAPVTVAEHSVNQEAVVQTTIARIKVEQVAVSPPTDVQDGSTPAISSPQSGMAMPKAPVSSGKDEQKGKEEECSVLEPKPSTLFMKGDESPENVIVEVEG